MLANLQWLRGRFASCGRASALSDCSYALRFLGVVNAHGESNLPTNDSRMAIQALRRTLMLVEDGVTLESDGLLAGSLIQIELSFSESDGAVPPFFHRLAKSVNCDSRGPWLKHIRGCGKSSHRNAIVEVVVGNGGDVWSLSALGDGLHSVSGSADGVVRVLKIAYLDTVLRLQGHTHEVTCVTSFPCADANSGSIDTFVLFSGSKDGNVRAWQVCFAEGHGAVESTVIVGGCGSDVRCLSVSEDGTLICAGSGAGDVFIWEQKVEDSSLCFELLTKFNCSKGGEQFEAVGDPAISESGTWSWLAQRVGVLLFGAEWQPKRSGQWI